MDSGLKQKLQNLENYLKDLSSVLVAYSGGVDSAFLAYFASEVLKEKMKAILFTTQLHTAKEIKEAYDFAHQFDIPLETLSIDVLSSDIFKSNPKNRCYQCKFLLFNKAIEVAETYNLKHVVDGSNMDDLNDYRPGAQALKELHVQSPLQKVELTKSEIRDLSQYYNLPTHNKEAMACLATRIPYGDEISCKKLGMIEEAEDLLRELGYRNVRARHFNNTVRIEVNSGQVQKLLSNLDIIENKMMGIGYKEVVIDKRGYKMGNLNDD